MRAYVGTYTSSGRSEGIYVFDWDESTGALTQVTSAAESDPSFLCFDPGAQFLFAVSEGDGLDGGEAASFRHDSASGILTPLSRQKTGGGQPCHLTTDLSGRWLIVVNHEHGSVATFPIDADGSLQPRSDLRQHEGSGPGPTQEGPHAHFVTFDPTQERVLVVDKGIDQVVRYRLNADSGRLVPDDPPFGRVHSGAAPRHISFHPNGRFAYVNGEADMTISAFTYPGLEELQVLPTIPDAAPRDGVSTAQIMVEPNGRFVYVSSRGHDSIAMFAIDQHTGTLTALGNVSTQGRTPRNFNIDPTGQRMYVANQRTDTIVQFNINQDSGVLEPTGAVTEVGAPVCIVFR
jgi:6-phosphogluconolactonase